MRLVKIIGLEYLRRQKAQEIGNEIWSRKANFATVDDPRNKATIIAEGFYNTRPDTIRPSYQQLEALYAQSPILREHHQDLHAQSLAAEFNRRVPTYRSYDTMERHNGRADYINARLNQEPHITETITLQPEATHKRDAIARVATVLQTNPQARIPGELAVPLHHDLEFLLAIHAFNDILPCVVLFYPCKPSYYTPNESCTLRLHPTYYEDAAIWQFENARLEKFLRDNQIVFTYDTSLKVRWQDFDVTNVRALASVVHRLSAAPGVTPMYYATSVPENIARTYYCPITKELMQHPVIAADGHSYEKAAIEDWFAQNRGRQALSPATGLPLEHNNIIPNVALMRQIAEHRDMEAAQSTATNTALSLIAS
ncbi:MAG TPA: U-box domain-containing protein [Gammaproteobacteria bacterium]|nr:U-box domain-containing protein [Gammaproteobacteria bacterium]